jgi:diaminopimelate decarboxylase
LALRAGFSPERILFTGTSVRDDELSFLLKSEVTINVDSMSQLHRLLKIVVPERLSVRINPEIGAGHHSHCVTAGRDSKFGLWEEDATNAYSEAKSAGVERFSIHMHIGSGILDIEPFVLAIVKLLSIAASVKDRLGVDFESINVGGGLGVPHEPEEKIFDLDLFSDGVLNLFRKKTEEYGFGEPYFCLEPGRYIMSDAGILLTRVNTVKITPFKKFVGVDAGFNTLVRPTMYGSYHHVILANRSDSAEEEKCDLVGPICESGDILAKGRRLPKIKEGDLLAVLNAGAYGFSMSSQYNSRPRAAEVLVRDGEYALVRKRETFKDLLANQRIARWLK